MVKASACHQILYRPALYTTSLSTGEARAIHSRSIPLLMLPTFSTVLKSTDSSATDVAKSFGSLIPMRIILQGTKAPMLRRSPDSRPHGQRRGDLVHDESTSKLSGEESEDRFVACRCRSDRSGSIARLRVAAAALWRWLAGVGQNRSSMLLSASLRIRSIMPYPSLRLRRAGANGEGGNHIRHDGLSIGSLDITKGHLGTLVLVESDLGAVDVCDPVERDW